MKKLAAFTFAMASLISTAIGQETKVVNDDRDVIQTAMLSFFVHEEWHSADWQPKHHVVLRTQLWGKEREPFEKAAEELAKSLADAAERLDQYVKKQNDPKTTAKYAPEVAELRASRERLIAAQTRTRTGSYVPPNLIPLASMQWDSRIKVTDDSNRFRMSASARDSSLETLTIYASAKRPSFSADGTLALLTFSIPWSMHGARVWFVYERTTSGWKRIAVHSVFYV